MADDGDADKLDGSDKEKYAPDLPVLVLDKIVAFSRLSEKRIMRLVCSSWRSALENQPVLQRNVFFRPNVTNASLDAFLVSNLVLDSATMTGVTVEDCPAHEKFPQIRSLEIGPNSDEVTKHILKVGAKSILELKVSEFGFAKVMAISWSSIIKYVEWTQLQELNLTIVLKENQSNKHIEAMIIFLKCAKMVSIQSLGFTLAHNCGPYVQPKTQLLKLCSGFYTFIGSNGQTLKSLSLKLGSYLQSGYKIPEPSSDLLKVFAALKIERCWVETNSPNLEALAFPCLLGTPGLKKFALMKHGHRFGAKSSALNVQKFNKIMKHNGPTLEEVSMEGDINMYWLKYCKSLISAILRVDVPNRKSIADLVLPTLKIVHCYEITTFVQVNGATIEELNFTSYFGEWNCRFLKDCTALKFLRCAGFDGNALAILSISDVVFPSLTKLKMVDPKTKPYGPYGYDEREETQVRFFTWVARAMPILEHWIVTDYAQKMDMEKLKILLGMPCLKQVGVFKVSDEVMETCSLTSGLKFVHVGGLYYRTHGNITFNRDVLKQTR